MIVSSQARKIGDEAVVFIDGELAQKSQINRAAFILTVCHEFGHIYNDKPGELRLKKEGLADYWAAGCAAEFFGQNPTDPVDSVPTFLIEKCQTDGNISMTACLQVASGIHSYAKFNGIDLSKGIDTRLNDRVSNSHLHPRPLCRVETFIAGLFGAEKPACIFKTGASKDPMPARSLVN